MCVCVQIPKTNAGRFAVRLGMNRTSSSYRKNHSAALGGQKMGGILLRLVASKVMKESCTSLFSFHLWSFDDDQRGKFDIDNA